MVRSEGMVRISLWSKKKIVLVPAAPVLLSPWAKAPSSFPKAVVHVSQRRGSLASSSYLLMVFPEVGWTTGLAKCSICGMAVGWLHLGRKRLEVEGVEA